MNKHKFHPCEQPENSARSPRIPQPLPALLTCCVNSGQSQQLQHWARVPWSVRFPGAGLGWGKEFLGTPLDKQGGWVSLSPLRKERALSKPWETSPGLGEDGSALEKGSKKTKTGADHTVAHLSQAGGSHTPTRPWLGASLLRRGLALAHTDLTRILAAKIYVPPEIRTSGASSCPTAKAARNSSTTLKGTKR